MVGWTARSLARLLQVPAPTVASWVTVGLVTPERYGRGRGGHVIGINGLLELLAVIELRQAGFSLQTIRRAVVNLREMSGHDRPLAKLILVVNGQDIFWMDANDVSGMPISALQSPGQRLMVFPIGEQHEEFLQKLSIRSEQRSSFPQEAIGETSSYVPKSDV